MVEKVLNLFGKKVLIGLIVSMFGIIGTLGYYIWDLKTSDNSSQEIAEISANLSATIMMVNNLQTELETTKNEAKINDLKVKTYIDKRVDFLVQNSESKNKQMMLQVLELTKEMPEKIIEYKPIRDTVVIREFKTITNKDTVYIEKEKKGIFKKMFNFDKK